MSAQKALNNLIKRLSGQSNILTIPKVFIDLTGDIKAALFLSQCIYWSDKTTRDDDFFYKSVHEWQDEIGMTRREIDRARRILGDMIETKTIKANGAPTVHYRVDIDKVTEKLVSICTKSTNPFVQNEQIEMYEMDKTDLNKKDKSLTETTKRIQTEIDTVKPPAVIFKLYQDTIGIMTPMIADELKAAETEYPAEWVEEAFKLAATRNVRKWVYVKKVLDNWKTEGRGRLTDKTKVTDFEPMLEQ